MFLVCGEALWDLFTGEETNGLGIEARIGGSPFNVAVGLARLQQDSALLTGISNDPMGQHDLLCHETPITALGSGISPRHRTLE